MVCLVLFNMLTNGLIKFGVEHIFKFLGKTSLPILGRGYRPNGALNCGLSVSCPSKLATTFGMPSGHSQIIWALATFIVMQVYYNGEEFFETSDYIGRSIGISIATLLFAVLVSFSRVYVKCHTIQQVTLGALIGAGIGAGAFFLYDKHKDKLGVIA